MFDTYSDPYSAACDDLSRFADDGGPAPDACDLHPTEDDRGQTMNDRPIDNHAHDFHVYVDGALRHRVPCGVCERDGDPALAEVSARYGTELHARTRETVRRHMEDYLRLAHPGSVVAVR